MPAPKMPVRSMVLWSCVSSMCKEIFSTDDQNRGSFLSTTYLKWIVGWNPVSPGRCPPPRVHHGNYNLLAFFSAISGGIPRIKHTKRLNHPFIPWMYSLPLVLAKAFWKILLWTSVAGVSSWKTEGNNQEWVVTVETRISASGRREQGTSATTVVMTVLSV